MIKDRGKSPSRTTLVTLNKEPLMSHSYDLDRRTLLKVAAGGVALVSMPAIVKAQSDVIRIGHLTPVTGFLGPLGEFAQMGVTLAAEEINASGGILGRKLELVIEDSVNPQTGSAKAERLIERDKVAMIIGEILQRPRSRSARSRTVPRQCSSIPAPIRTRCAARAATRTCFTSRRRTR